MYSMLGTRETRNHLSLEAFLYCADGGTLAQSAQRLWSLLVALWKLSGCGPLHPVLGILAWVSPGPHVHKALSTLTILGFCEHTACFFPMGFHQSYICSWDFTACTWSTVVTFSYRYSVVDIPNSVGKGLLLCYIVPITLKEPLSLPPRSVIVMWRHCEMRWQKWRQWKGLLLLK